MVLGGTTEHEPDARIFVWRLVSTVKLLQKFASNAKVASCDMESGWVQRVRRSPSPSSMHLCGRRVPRS